MLKHFAAWWAALRGRLESKLPASAFQPPPGEEVLRKRFLLILALWGVCWFLLPLAVLDNVFVDVPENIIWGSYFQFGYDKNPYLGAWIGYLGSLLAGNSLWSSHLLSQLFVLTGLVCVWKLGRRMTTPAGAFLAALFLLGVNFYGIKSVELCDDVMELGFWPLLLLFFHKALKERGGWGAWFAVGLLAGCCFMVKYYAAVLFASMFLLMLFTPEGRRAFRTPGPYWAALVCALISLPNLIWLVQNDMVALRYAFGRASLGDGAREVELSYSRLLEQPLRCLNRAVSVLIVPLVPFLLIFFRRDPAMASDLFDRRFVAFLGLGPFAFTLLFSLLSGGSINYSWVVPCFPLSGLFLVLWFKPYINRFSLKWFTGFLIFLWVVFAVIFTGRSLWQQPYRKRGCDYENFPGKALAEHVTREWRTRYGTPLPFVIGPRRESCNVAVYSADRPQAYFSANPEFSQWIDEEEIREKGAVILFDGRPKRRPRWLGRLTESGFSLTPEVRIEEERAVPGWFRALAGPPKKDAYIYCFIPPAEP